MSLYTGLTILEIMVMIIMLPMVWASDALDKRTRTLFSVILSLIVIEAFSEWLGIRLNNTGPDLRWANGLIRVIEHSVAPVIAFLCAELTGFRPKLRDWMLALIPAHAIAELVSMFAGFIFYIDAENIYHHGRCYFVYLVVYTLESIYCVIEIGRFGREYQVRTQLVLGAMMCTLFFGVGISFAASDVMLSWCTVANVMILMYVLFTSMLHRVDIMTSLQTRASYEQRIHSLRDKCTILMFDVDSFKRINDVYGHQFGDDCLRIVGRCIRTVYGKSGQCYRIGGDEFCAILNEADLDVEEINSRFFGQLDVERKKDTRIPYVSIGYDVFDPESDQVENVIRNADAMMYRFKERNKIVHTLPKKKVTELLPAQASDVPDTLTNGIDTSGLSDRIFNALAGTSEHTYLYLANMNTGVMRWSRNAVDYFGLPGEYTRDYSSWDKLIHPEDLEAYQKDIRATFEGRKAVHNVEYRVKNRYGDYVVCTCRGVILPGDESNPPLFAGTLTNHGITGGIDPITGLHSTPEFNKAIQRMLQRNAGTCVMKIGVENFRHINAMYGYAGGNRVLKLLGLSMKNELGGQGGVFRLDGSKFALFIKTSNREEAREFYEKLRTIAEKDIQIDDMKIPVRLYCGAILLENYGGSAYTVRSGLIYAMEQSKDKYRGKLVFVDEIIEDQEPINIDLHHTIHRCALNDSEGFYMLYQPIVSAETHDVIGAEALLRWKKEPYGIVPPDRFIPWLENDPCFIQLGKWIMRRAITEMLPMLKEHPDFILNVNIAATQIEHSDFRSDVLQILDETGWPAENLCLELTERCRHMDYEFLNDELTFFAGHGIKIALDDFGTGMSSLGLLFQFDVDELKLDRMFIMDIMENPGRQRLMESILRGAAAAGIRTCVEGIETEEEAELVASYSGDFIQGYYFSKPLDRRAFLEYCIKR